jgi:hypothetical protein
MIISASLSTSKGTSLMSTRDNGDAFVTAGRRPQGIDEFHAAADRGAEADAEVGAVDVVVHGLGAGHDVHAFPVQARGVGQGVVAADGHQRPDPQLVQRGHHVIGAVDPVAGPGIEVRLQGLGQIPGQDLAGIGARGMKDRAAGPVDAVNRVAVQHDGMVPKGLLVLGIDMQRPGPAAAEAERVPAEFLGPGDDGFDAGVEAGNVAPAGQDAYAHVSIPLCCPLDAATALPIREWHIKRNGSRSVISGRRRRPPALTSLVFPSLAEDFLERSGQVGEIEAKTGLPRLFRQDLLAAQQDLVRHLAQQQPKKVAGQGEDRGPVERPAQGRREVPVANRQGGRGVDRAAGAIGVDQMDDQAHQIVPMDPRHPLAAMAQGPAQGDVEGQEHLGQRAAGAGQDHARA